MQYLILLLSGIITFISPCVLPMLPVYVSYFAAGEADKTKTLFNAVGFTIGFTIVFVTLGALAGSLGQLVRTHATAVNVITGLIVVALGLNYLGVIRLRFLERGFGTHFQTRKQGFFSSIFLGFVFSVAWTPCADVFLGSALSLASQQGSMMQGVIMLFIFSLGLGIPFIISALLLDRLKSSFDFIKKNYRIINIVSGVLLVIMGLLMATGYLNVMISGVI